MGQLKTKTKQMPGEEAAIHPDDYETKDDPVAEVDVTEEVDEQPEEKFSAQILRRIHEHHSLLMQEYDELAQMNEHEEIGEFLTGILEGLEQVLTSTEELFEKHHGDLPPLEGTLGKDLEDDEAESTEADSEKEELPTPEEVVEGMETKAIKGKRTKAMTKEESEDVVDKIREEADDKEEKHLCGRCKADAGADLGNEEFQPVLDAEPAASPAEDTNLGDEEQVKSWKLSSKATALDAAGYLKKTAETEDFNEDSRFEAFHHGKMLEKACKEFPINPQVGDSDLEVGNPADLPVDDGLKSLPDQDQKGTAGGLAGAGVGFMAGGPIGAAVGGMAGDAMTGKSIAHPAYKACSGAGGFMNDLAHTRDFGDPHREKALTWHKALGDAFGDPEESLNPEDKPELPLGEVQEKGMKEGDIITCPKCGLKWKLGPMSFYPDGKTDCTACGAEISIKSLGEKAFPEMDKEEDDAKINEAEKSVPGKVKSTNGSPADPTKALEQSFAKAIAERESNAKQMKKLQQQLAAVASRLN